MSYELDKTDKFFIGKGVWPEATAWLDEQEVNVPALSGRCLHRR